MPGLDELKYEYVARGDVPCARLKKDRSGTILGVDLYPSYDYIRLYADMGFSLPRPDERALLGALPYSILEEYTDNELILIITRLPVAARPSLVYELQELRSLEIALRESVGDYRKARA